MKHPSDLEKAAQAFRQWHLERSSLKSKTPEVLREQALALMPHYKKSVIARTLGIRAESLRRWSLAKTKASQPEMGVAPEDFIVLPASQQSNTNELELTLTFTRGDKLQLSGALPTPLILSMVQTMADGDAL